MFFAAGSREVHGVYGPNGLRYGPSFVATVYHMLLPVQLETGISARGARIIKRVKGGTLAVSRENILYYIIFVLPQFCSKDSDNAPL